MPKQPDQGRLADAAMERLLQRELATALDPSGTCVDAETIAAWSDGSLDPGEARLIETHLSTCARCQAVLAAFARTDVVPAPARSWWSSAALRWVVPAAAVATAAIFLWVVWPGNRPPARVQTIAQVNTPSSSIPSASAPSQTPVAPVERRDEARGGMPASSPAGAARIAPTTRGANAPEKQKDKASAGGHVEEGRPVAQGTNERSPGSEAASNAATAAKSEIATDSNGIRPSAPSTLQDTTRANRPDEMLDATLEITALAPAPALALAQSAPSRERIQNQARRTRWRVLVNGDVERSADAGATWTHVLTEPAGTITAGSAPSDDVCWLAGKNGVVLRTTDGLHFATVSPPGNMDVSSIVAADASQATITTSGGRTLGTSDAGTTWH